MTKLFAVWFLTSIGLCSSCTCFANEQDGPISVKRVHPWYRVVRIRPPKGYTVATASFTDTGWIVGKIGDGLPQTNTPEGKVATRAFIWRNGRMRVMAQSDWPNAEADDVSADGREVIGTATSTWDGAWLGSADVLLLWRDGTVRELHGPDSMTDSSASKIGKNGDIFGYCRASDTADMTNEPQPVACKWVGPKHTPVVLSDQSLVAGSDYKFAHGARATVELVHTDSGDLTSMIKVKRTGLRYDLSSCLVNAHGMKISEADDIDDRGWIVAEIPTGDFVVLKPVNP